MANLVIAMAVIRSVHLAAMLSLLGAAGFLAWMLPAVAVVPANLSHALRRLWWISGLVALVAGIAWFALQTVAIADTTTVSETLAVLPVVAFHTRFGTILALRLALLAAATVAACRSSTRTSIYTALVVTAFALGLQGVIGHAGAAAGTTGQGLVLSEALHLVAAAIWLGALLPLWLSVRLLPPTQSAFICDRFSPIALACVLVLAGTGAVQGLQLIGSIPALFGTPYGNIALIKIALFLLALVLAAINRLRLTDRLAEGVARARAHLLLSVGTECAIGLAIVTAAAFLASSSPGAHSPPVWPFPWQFSLATMNENPDLRREVFLSLTAIGAGVLVMAAALWWRRHRLVALAVLAGVLATRGPSLSWLTVEAYPTSFQTSPTNFAAASIVQGQTVFARNCVTCHGPRDTEAAPDAEAQRITPIDLTLPHIWQHTDGALFWWISHGVDDPAGGTAMPGFGNALSATERWALIDYIRAHNVGASLPDDATIDQPVRAPAHAIACSGIPASNMSDLVGHPVYVVTSDGPAMQIDSHPSTVVLDLRDKAAADPGTCVAADPSAWDAYAVLAGMPSDKLAGSAFLIDPDQWLRAVHRAGTAGGWSSGAELTAAVRAIGTHPIKQILGGQHEHHH